MIGNDIIDLSYAKKESNWKRKGFLNKIYTLNEQKIIHTATNPELFVWLLWSMKEAAYKANHRITKVREYAPIKINCEINFVESNIYYGNVIYNDLKYYTKSLISNEYIHTIALHNSNEFSVIKVILINNYPLNYYDYLNQNNYLNVDKKIVKDEFGIPNLYNEISTQSVPMSISHHGNFLSLVIT